MSLTIGELVGYIRADGSDFNRNLARSQLQMEGFRLDVNGRLRDLSGRFVDESAVMGRALADGFSDAERAGTRIVTVYNSVADAQSRTIRARFQRLRDESSRMGAQVSRAWGRLRSGIGDIDLSRLRGVASGIGSAALSLGRVAAVAGAAVPVVAGLAAAVAKIAPAAGVAVTALFAVQLASKALQLGMVGVSDAVSAALDPSKAAEFDEALKKLSPNARSFALAVKGLAPEFKELQQAVQDKLFSGMDTVMKNMAVTTLPVLKKGLTDAAGALNLMGKGVGSAASKMAKNGTLGVALDGATGGLKNLSRIPGQVTQGLIQIGAAAAPSFERLTKAGGNAFDRLSEKMAKSFESGGMEDAIETAIDLLGQMGGIAKNIFGGIGNILKGTAAGGGGFLQVLEKISAAFKAFTGSREFQEALGEISKTVGTLVATALPLLSDALTELLPIFKILGPPIRELIKELGKQMGPLIKELGPVVVELASAFAELIPVVTPFLVLAMQLATDILPLLTPLFAFLGELFKQLAPVAKQVAENMATQLKPILEKLPGILEQFLPKILELTAYLFPLLLELLIELGPELGELATAFSELMVELGPLIVQLLEFNIMFLEKIMPYVGPLARLLGGLLVGALQTLTNFIDEFVAPALRTVSALFRGDWDEAFKQAATFVANFRRRSGEAFQWMKENIPRIAAEIASGVARRAGEMALKFVEKVGELRDGATRVLRSLPGRMTEAIGDVGRLLWYSGSRLIQGFIDGIMSRIGDVGRAASSVVGRARDFFPFSPAKRGPFSGKGYTLYSGQAIARDLAAGMLSRRDAVGMAARRLAAQAHLGGVGGPLALPAGGMPGLGMGGAPAFAGAGGAGAQRIVWEVRGDGTQWGEFLAEQIRTQVDVKGGGDVQRAFGSRRYGTRR
ncbi:phage tail protein [Streptomyces sp. NPDC055078]